MFKGIDISTDQGAVDFAAVKASGVQFVFAKASEGITYCDDHFAQYHDACKEHGLAFGAYHFLLFNDDPAAQAAHFLATIEGRAGTLLPMADVEVTDGDTADSITARLSAFLTEIEKTLNGKRALLYTFYSFWNDTMKGSTAFSGHPLWIAAYNNDAEPPIPAGFKSAAIWQHSSKGSIPGIVGDVDLDTALVDLADISR